MDRNRKAAFSVLLKIEKNAAYSNIELNRLQQKGGYEMPFIRELVYGTLKRKYLLDHYIGQLAKNGADSIGRDVLILLRTGIYQIEFMDSVPDYAACDETCTIAKEAFHGKAGFVNGILRNFIRKRQELKGPDTIKDPVERLSVCYSAAPWIVRRFLEDCGAEQAEAVLKASNETPELTLRVNTARTGRGQLIEALEQAGIACGACGLSQNVITAEGGNVTETEAFRNGWFFIQDVSSAAAVEALAPEPGETVVDVCAAPGGKTFSAACLMEGRGRIVSMDLHERKLKALEKQAARLGFDLIETEPRDARDPADALRGKADRVICDAPCSGLGVLRKKPEIKYKDITDGGKGLADIQFGILNASKAYLKPGGRLMYSTCTISRIENGDVVRRFLRENKDCEIAEEKQFVTGEGGADGFYYCVMRSREG